MTEYIDREALIKALEADFNTDWADYASKNNFGKDYIDGVRDEYDDVMKIICQQRNLTDEEAEIYDNWLNAEAEETGLTLVYDDESGTWGEAPEIYGSIAFETQEALEKAVNILNNYKWTSVDEALPIYDGLVLICYNDKTIRLAIYSEDGWYSDEGNPIMEQPDYWVRIPEPPKTTKG